jgi:purine-binding chemotaxis protein CheW
MDKESPTITNSFLSFKLEDEIFAANVSKVLNILEMTKITKVPKMPPYMKGVINLRGTVLPVIDLRLKFGMTETEYNVNTCILVLDVNIEEESVMVGALVDAVLETLEVDSDKMLPPPSMGGKFKSDLIENIIKKDNDFIMVLDMDKVFSTDEVVELNISKIQDSYS